jgi:phage tail sheath protein FI
MPEYLYPGVYIEEVSTGNAPIEGVSTSTAGFLGIAERGPNQPVLCTSFGDYQRSFGSYVQDPDGTDHYLAYAVEGFFQNGGLRCFVQRVFHQDTQTPANSAQDAEATAGGMEITAIGPGAWGNTIAYQISAAGMGNPSLFKLTVLYWTGTPSTDLVSNPTASEIYDNLSSTPSDSNFYGSAINDVSNLITVTQNAAGRPPNNPLNAAGTDPNVVVNALSVTPATGLTVGGTLIVAAGGNKQTFTVNPNPPAGSPTIITVLDLITVINDDTTVGAKATLNRSGNVSILDPGLNGDIAVTGTLTSAGVNLGTFSSLNPNQVAGSNTGLTSITALTDGATMVVSVGGANTNLQVNATAGPIETVNDLINQIGTIAGLTASLDSLGRLNIVDAQSRANLSVTGSLASSNANLGSFTQAAPALNNAGAPILLAGGNNGINPNIQAGSVEGLALTTALSDKDTLVVSTGGAQTTFAMAWTAVPPIKTVSDLITAIANKPALGLIASLNADGQFVVQDTQSRGNLEVTGTLAGTQAAPGPLGVFTAAAATYTEADFEGNDIDPTAKTGLLALGDVDQIALLACPDEFYFGTTSNAVAQMLQEQCETQMDRFAILDAPVAAGPPQSNNPSVNSEYCAYYYPWLTITNPNTDVNLLVPPCGHIAGIYARSDTNYGVQKDPANEVINGIVQLQLNVNNQQQAILNPKGVNCLRYFTGAGNLVWGGRTTSTDPDWQYINVRRIFIFVEQSIKLGTQWVVFDINADPTWRRVVRSISDFLTTLWREGMLQGATKDQAFFVRCDNTTMTQADIDAGRLICVIGIAPVKPAEFVIFQIGQWYGGSSVTEQ